eukprot:RCo053856
MSFLCFFFCSAQKHSNTVFEGASPLSSVFRSAVDTLFVFVDSPTSSFVVTHLQVICRLLPTCTVGFCLNRPISSHFLQRRKVEENSVGLCVCQALATCTLLSPQALFGCSPGERLAGGFSCVVREAVPSIPSRR